MCVHDRCASVAVGCEAGGAGDDREQLGGVRFAVLQNCARMGMDGHEHCLLPVAAMLLDQCVITPVALGVFLFGRTLVACVTARTGRITKWSGNRAGRACGRHSVGAGGAHGLWLHLEACQEATVLHHLNRRSGPWKQPMRLMHLHMHSGGQHVGMWEPAGGQVWALSTIDVWP